MAGRDLTDDERCECNNPEVHGYKDHPGGSSDMGHRCVKEGRYWLETELYGSGPICPKCRKECFQYENGKWHKLAS